MPEDLGEGLYLAGVGMGLVFLSLLAFMLILFALQKLFPSEEVAEIVEADETGEAMRASEDPAPAVSQEPAVAIGVSTEGGIPGAKIAAMAVGMYLATEQEEQVEQSSVIEPVATLSEEESPWNTPSRGPSWGNQGRRPPPYGQKIQSAYPPKDSLKE